MRYTKFTIVQTTRRCKKYWRIRIPGRLRPDGKPRDLLYRTRAEAENDRRILIDRFNSGELSAKSLLTRDQIDDVRAAYRAIVASGIEMTLEQAAHIAIERKRAQLAGVSVAEMLERYEAEVSAARQWSAKYRATWRLYSRRFVEAWGAVNIANIATEPLREFYAENYGRSASYYNSAIAVISPAFTWAVKRGMLQKSPFDALERRKNAPKDGVDVFTPEEAKRLLSACLDYRTAGASHPMADEAGKVRPDLLQDCRDALVPFAILLFAGVRPEELTKLTWEDVVQDAARGGMSIRIGASVAKTRQIRLVRVRPTLQAFIDLVPERERKGRIVPSNWTRKAGIVRKAAGLQNRADAARHSFASYALAAGNGVDAVRDDLGHARGSDMLFRHYRAAVTRADAEIYWAIEPIMS